jgi:HTH-type transcriptional regulator/antitoxin HipB
MIPITSPETLGKALRRCRKERGLTQSEAGRSFNLPQKTISRIESGVGGVQISTVFKYLSALDLELHLEPREKPDQDEALW